MRIDELLYEVEPPMGKWTVVRVDGTIVPMETKPTIDRVDKELGCDCVDSVTLTWGPGNVPDVVMLVDDTGMIDGKPVNPKATALYHSRCLNAEYQIHGDVAIVRDGDF